MAKAKDAHRSAVVYVRTSTKAQKDAATIEAQIATCAKLVERHGLKLIAYGAKKDGWIRDDGVSGSLLEGRALGRFIDDLEAGRIHVDFLVTYSMSRLARHDKASKDISRLVRSAQDKARISAVLNGRGVQIVDSDGINDPASVLTEIKETLSGEEYRLIRTRTADGKARILASGGWATGGRVPYGYKRVRLGKKEGSTLALDEVEAPRFRKLMAEYVENGAAHAARFAMSEGWQSPRRSKTNAWYPSTIQQFLNNLPAYRGESTLSIDGQPFPVTYPPLLDATSYARIERRMREHCKRTRTTLLGTGYVDCGVCRGHIHGSRASTQDHFFVTCRNRCTRMREDVFAERLWEFVEARLVQIANHGKSGADGPDQLGARIDAARKKLSDVAKKLESVLELFLEDEMDKETLTTKSSALRRKKTQYQAELDGLNRERDALAAKKFGVETVHQRVRRILRDFNRRTPSLEEKRKTLADLLDGARVILTRKQSGQTTSLSLTMPPFDDLEAITVSLDRDITAQVHNGMDREGLDFHYYADIDETGKRIKTLRSLVT